MSTKDMMDAVDQEIARLQLIRDLLAGENRFSRKGAKAKKASPLVVKRVLSAEARERIASAQRKRWAAVAKAGRKAARQTARA